MARVDPNSTLGGVRGSVAGFYSSADLPDRHARPPIAPPRSRSYLQATQRIYLGQIAAYWKSLGATQRADWATAAALTA